MEFILLNETPMETNYRIFSWNVFKYFCTHTSLLDIKKYSRIYSEIYNYFIERKKKQFCIDQYDGEKIIQLAITEYSSLLHEKKLSIEEIDEYVENYDSYKHLLVIRPKNKTS